MDEPRRMPAGHVLLIAVIALAVAALLNAQGLRKTAYSQPEGWRRDVALAVTRPLAATTHFLGIDRPRAELKAAVGHGGDDRVATAIRFAPPRTGARPASSAPASRPLFTASHPARLWVAGDSLAIAPGEALAEAASTEPAVEPVGPVDGRLSTGLTRPDVFNWYDHVRTELDRLRPDAIVLSFGANDDHMFMSGLRAGVTLGPFGSRAWMAEYRRRVGGMMDEVTARGRKLVWIGPPIVRDPQQSRRFATLGRLYAAEAAERPGRVAYVDTYSLFTSREGGYADYLPGPGGRLERVRSTDGVHLELAGARRVARVVLRRLAELVRLRPPPRVGLTAPPSSGP